MGARGAPARPDARGHRGGRRGSAPFGLLVLQRFGIDACCGGSLTLAQAAASAGVPVETLLLGAGARRGAAADMRPPALDRLSETARVYLDVREDLREGREPFARIMAAVDALRARRRAGLAAPFEPVPLYRVLARGLRPLDGIRRGPGLARVVLSRGRDGRPGGGAPVPPTPVGAAGAAPPGADSIVRLDVRGLEPPLPMVRVLEAVEVLAPGQRLEVLRHRRPSSCTRS